MPDVLAPARSLSDSHAAADPPPRCLNCEAALAGPYCAQCGQRDLPPEPTAGELLAEAWDTFVSIDGKVASTLRLLLARPGSLTAEYLRGHRARYLPPLRLYMVCSVLYFLTSAALPDRDDGRTARERAARGDIAAATLVKDDLEEARDALGAEAALDSTRRDALASIGRPAGVAPLDSAQRALADSVRVERKVQKALGDHPGMLKRLTVGRLVRNSTRVAREKKNMDEDIKRNLPRVLFVLMPLFAGMLALAYRSRRRRFPAHLVVSLHLHAFAFAALTLAALTGAVPARMPRLLLLTAITLWTVAYVPRALREVYGGRLAPAVARAAALASVYFVTAVLAALALVVALVWMY